MKKGKLVIIGAGNVGASIAFVAMQKGLFSEIVIIDLNHGKAQGEALDMMHGVSFVSPVQVYSGDYSDCKGADIVVITAGAAQTKNESRRDLLKRNAAIFKSIIQDVTKYCGKNTFFLPVTNPVDVLAYLTWRISGHDRAHVLGSGTVLDTSRLKYALSVHTGIDPGDIDAFVLGEHGDSELAAWSKTTIAGMTVPQFCVSCGKCDGRKIEDLFSGVKNAAYDIIAKKGSTFYAIALATNRILEAVMRDSNSILTVSTLLDGQYGIDNVYLSVPTVVNAGGASRILELPLSDEELALLHCSAKTLKKLYTEIGL